MQEDLRYQSSPYLSSCDHDSRIHIDPSLLPVVDEISAAGVAKEAIWELYTSRPEETGGNIAFPYCRVDKKLITCRDLSRLIVAADPEAFQRHYATWSRIMFQVTTWVEKGYGGIERYIQNAPLNEWTIGVPAGTPEQEKRLLIMRIGTELYGAQRRQFSTFRSHIQTPTDYFTMYGCEDLLSS